MLKVDPKTFDEYQKRFSQNSRITGSGDKTVTHFPCPGCASPDWLEWPITAGLDDYKAVQAPSKCKVCKRTFRIKVMRSGANVSSKFVQVDGPAIPDYLPPIGKK